eukprot:SAG11_NODE_9758_length_882_cov_4.375479_2_plen_80_part_00
MACTPSLLALPPHAVEGELAAWEELVVELPVVKVELGVDLPSEVESTEVPIFCFESPELRSEASQLVTGWSPSISAGSP